LDQHWVKHLDCHLVRVLVHWLVLQREMHLGMHWGKCLDWHWGKLWVHWLVPGMETD
jgi:hypothetical protein